MARIASVLLATYVVTIGIGLHTEEFQFQKYTAALELTMYRLGFPVGREGGATEMVVAVIDAIRNRD